MAQLPRVLRARDFFDEEFYLNCLQDYEQLRAFRNRVSKGKPSETDILILRLNKHFENFYAAILFP